MHPIVLDLIGAFVFALSGAAAGVKRQLDLFGVLVLAFAAATVGGIVRDVLIGVFPPVAIADWRFLGASLVAGGITFVAWHTIDRLKHPVLLFDAAGLSMVAIAGASKSLAHGIHPVMAAVLGMVTGIGGGVARDVLLAEVPAVLRADLYAVAALAGAMVAVVGAQYGYATPAAIIGALLCFALRFMAIFYGWHLPTSPRKGRRTAAFESDLKTPDAK